MKRIVLVTVSACSLLAATFMISSSQNVLAKGKGPCWEDRQKFCKGIKGGEGRVWACLKSHEAELSEPCKAKIAGKKENSKEFRAACRNDARTLCKGIPRGKGRVYSCLKSNMDKLSEPCKAYFSK